ncbi:hypothetical protein [Herbiconiux sp. UC225_62]|uniref:hypothetical protein n=1 Tax=Herbiconiux sp. UC225_62 TaxID=3350168 RepID=UPI0036D2DB0D
MERIHYAGDSLLTGSDIARALLEYASALARNELSATVDIPVRHDDGSIGHANFLIGPASQLVSETEPSPFDELTDPSLVEMLTHETNNLRPAHPVVSSSEPDDELNLMDDL